MHFCPNGQAIKDLSTILASETSFLPIYVSRHFHLQAITSPRIRTFLAISGSRNEAHSGFRQLQNGEVSLARKCRDVVISESFLKIRFSTWSQNIFKVVVPLLLSGFNTQLKLPIDTFMIRLFKTRERGPPLAPTEIDVWCNLEDVGGGGQSKCKAKSEKEQFPEGLGSLTGIQCIQNS